MNQEQFEELLCWFELPTLLGIVASNPLMSEEVAQATSLPNYQTTLLQGAGFEYQRFLELLSLKSSE